MAFFPGDENNNRLRGDLGPDVMSGFGGDDNLSGNPLIGRDVSPPVPPGDDDILYGGAGDDNLDMDVQRFTLSGRNPPLRAMAGNDTMYGGTGDDWYGVESQGDVIIEFANEGVDTVFVNLPVFDARTGYLVNIENIVTMYHDSAGSTDAPRGNLTYYGNNLNNILVGAGGSDKLYGFGGDDKLVGNVQVDGDIDLMVGGDGNDQYEVDNFLDEVVELPGGGIDTIRYTLLPFRPNPSPYFSLNVARFENVENLVYGGDGDPNLERDLNISLFLEGNARNNEIVGGNFADRLVGLSGNDRLVGGKGADVMEGGPGDDYYIVDDPSDLVVESFKSGNDTVATNLESFSLNASHLRNVENLYVSDVRVERDDHGFDFVHSAPTYSYINEPRSHTLQGNALANKIIGGDLADFLYGLNGNDLLIGGAGADRLVGGKGDDEYEAERGDVVIEMRGGGDDIVRTTSTSYTLPANVEDLVFGGGNVPFVGRGNVLSNAISGAKNADRLSGYSGNDTLLGRDGKDILIGGVGDDTLYGGRGRDVLTGNTGEDWFVFDTKPGTGNVDVIRDFRVVADTIFLDNAVYSRVGANGYLAAGAFHVGSRATDESDRIIYNKVTGTLAYDPDGNGSAVAAPFAQVARGLAMTFADFYII